MSSIQLITKKLSKLLVDCDRASSEWCKCDSDLKTLFDSVCSCNLLVDLMALNLAQRLEICSSSSTDLGVLREIEFPRLRERLVSRHLDEFDVIMQCVKVRSDRMIASVVKIEDAMNSAFDIYEQNSHLDIEQFTSADIPVVSVASLLQCLESLDRRQKLLRTVYVATTVMVLTDVKYKWSGSTVIFNSKVAAVLSVMRGSYVIPEE